MTSRDTTVPTVTLNAGVEIPQLGFGTWEVKPDEAVDTVVTALEIGYRHIDTAQMYRNEAEVGEAVRRSGIPRDEVFLTSKLANDAHRRDDVLRTFDESLRKLGVDTLDLFLIHWPMPQSAVDYVETWGALGELVASGRLRAAGVSNFTAEHLDRLAAASDLVPAVNQIEAHPFLAQAEQRADDAARGIATEAWSPLASGRVASDPTIGGIAEQLGRTPAQVALRWTIQRGDIVFPRSVRAERIRENFAIFDFELSDDQVAAIDALDDGGRVGSHPDAVN